MQPTSGKRILIGAFAACSRPAGALDPELLGLDLENLADRHAQLLAWMIAPMKLVSGAPRSGDDVAQRVAPRLATRTRQGAPELVGQRPGIFSTTLASAASKPRPAGR